MITNVKMKTTAEVSRLTLPFGEFGYLGSRDAKDIMSPFTLDGLRVDASMSLRIFGRHVCGIKLDPKNASVVVTHEFDETQNGEQILRAVTRRIGQLAAVADEIGVALRADEREVVREFQYSKGNPIRLSADDVGMSQEECQAAMMVKSNGSMTIRANREINVKSGLGQELSVGYVFFTPDTFIIESKVPAGVLSTNLMDRLINYRAVVNDESLANFASVGESQSCDAFMIDRSVRLLNLDEVRLPLPGAADVFLRMGGIKKLSIEFGDNISSDSLTSVQRIPLVSDEVSLGLINSALSVARQHLSLDERFRMMMMTSEEFHDFVNDKIAEEDTGYDP